MTDGKLLAERGREIRGMAGAFQCHRGRKSRPSRPDARRHRTCYPRRDRNGDRACRDTAGGRDTARSPKEFKDRTSKWREGGPVPGLPYGRLRPTADECATPTKPARSKNFTPTREEY